MPLNVIRSPERYEELHAAALPTFMEVLSIQQALRHMITESGASRTELISRVWDEAGVGAGDSTEYYEVGDGPIDPDSPTIKRERLRYAGDLALSRLEADGVIVPSLPDEPIHVQVHQQGSRGASPSLSRARRCRIITGQHRDGKT